MDIYSLLYKNTTVMSIVDQYNNGKASHVYVVEGEKTLVTFVNKLLSAVFVGKPNGGLNDVETLRALRMQSQNVYYYPQNDRVTMQSADAKDILEQSSFMPANNGNMVFVIDATVTGNSNEIWQNKLLKILEEPPENTYFFIGVTNSIELLETVLSRSNVVKLTPSKPNEILDVLNENGYSKETCEIATGLSKGNILKAEMLTNVESIRLFDTVINVLSSIKGTANSITYVSMLSEFISSAEKMLEMLDVMSFCFDQRIKYQCAPNLFLLNSRKSDIIALQNNFSLTASTHAIIEINQASDRIDKKHNATVVLDNLILKILEVRYIYA